MPAFFSKVFRSRDAAASASAAAALANDQGRLTPSKPRWDDAWRRTEVEPEEVQRLLHGCTLEVKSRALTLPFLLLPFRPNVDVSAAKLFVRNYFNALAGNGAYASEEDLQRELRLTEPAVLCSVLKWCWSRLPGGVVTWDAYELFRIGEQDSNMARDSFATFLPLSVDSDARLKIIFDFFDLLAAIAAHGKTNGFGGRKLSRLAGWWAFSHSDQGDGFDGGYRSWAKAADATSHLFFAYLRSLSPQAAPGTDTIMSLPRSLQALLQATEYPPQTPVLLQHPTAKVVMIVETVSATPFSLLRRAKHFEYRDDDRALRAFADFDDPVQALTDECRRVLYCISSTNQSASVNVTAGNAPREAAWSRFEDLGFSSLIDEPDRAGSRSPPPRGSFAGLNATARSGNQGDLGRPTTPSWADFLSAGFAEQPSGPQAAPLLLPPDKVLPPLEVSRAPSAKSHWSEVDDEGPLDPGELASITVIHLDDSFWWVWITSLAGEEPAERKAVFGRCAVIETGIAGGRWLVVEEKVKGAAPLPAEGAHIVEKKRRFGLTRRGRGISWRGRSAGSKSPPPIPETPYAGNRPTPASKTSLGPDQHARIQAAAAALQQKQRQRGNEQATAMRRARTEDILSTKTNSVFTLQPLILSEAAPALRWANNFDKDVTREHDRTHDLPPPGKPSTNGAPPSGPARDVAKDRELPALPRGEDPPRPAPVHAFTDGMAYQAMVPAPLSFGSQSAAPPPAPPSTDAASKSKGLPLPAESTTSLHLPPAERSTIDLSSPASGRPDEAADMRASTDAVGDPRAAKRLHKRAGGPAGLKKFFGKKNGDRPASPSPLAEQTPLEVPQPQHPGLGRRLSTLRKKSSPKVAQVTVEPTPESPVVVDIHDLPAASRDSVAIISGPQAALTPEESPTAAPPEPTGVNGVNGASAPPAPSTSFHQGPLEDVPAFVPDDSPVDSPERAVSPLPVQPPAEPEMVADESVSEQSVELKPVAVTPPLDRWAQIRKNAAERAAMKAHEEQSRLSQAVRTEDGETSGEETIESRVARIKARVAELTGNLDESNTSRPVHR